MPVTSYEHLLPERQPIVPRRQAPSTAEVDVKIGGDNDGRREG